MYAGYETKKPSFLHLSIASKWVQGESVVHGTAIHETPTTSSYHGSFSCMEERENESGCEAIHPLKIGLGYFKHVLVTSFAFLCVHDVKFKEYLL